MVVFFLLVETSILTKSFILASGNEFLSTGNGIVVFQVFSTNGNYYWNLGQVNCWRRNIFLPVDASFLDIFRDFKIFFKWKQLFCMVETHFLTNPSCGYWKRIFCLVEIVFFFTRAIFLLVEAIIGIREKIVFKERAWDSCQFFSVWWKKSNVSRKLFILASGNGF